MVSFGDEGWGDYDWTIEARNSVSPGNSSFNVSFRSDEWMNYALVFGGDKLVLLRHSKEMNKKYPDVKKKGGNSEIQSTPATIRPGEWYKLKISVRGPSIRIEIDDHLLFACIDNFSQKGLVGFRCNDSAVRFRNIKVTAADGTVLWEGLPDLPNE